MPTSIPLSALQHYLFCPRQCALIHVERLWAENVLTAEGRILHERSDKPGQASRGERRIVQGMPIRSRALGRRRRRRRGRADPRGRALAALSDRVQARPAQGPSRRRGAAVRPGALPRGDVFRSGARGRPVLRQGAPAHAVAFDDELRALTREVAAATRALLAAGRTPPPVYESKRCDACSLLQLCRPKRLARPGPVAAWLRRRIEEAEPPSEPPTETTA